MPECDGYEATTRLRRSQNAEVRALPVIALTASAIKGDRERALAAGMNDYLSKPVKRAALESMLTRWLFDASARQALSKYLANPAPGAEGSRASETESRRSSFSLSDEGISDLTTAKMVVSGSSWSNSSARGAGERASDNTSSKPSQSTTTTSNLRKRSSASPQGDYFPPVSPTLSPDAPTTNEDHNIETLMQEAAALDAPSVQVAGGSVESVAKGLLGALERSGTANTAALAAALLPRRGSHEGVPSNEERRYAKRPAPSPRAHSHHGSASPSTSTPMVTFQSSSGMSSGGPTSSKMSGRDHASRSRSGSQASAASASSPNSRPTRPGGLMRRSSRNQAGMGRDLQQELFNAADGSSEARKLAITETITPPEEEPPNLELDDDDDDDDMADGEGKEDEDDGGDNTPMAT